MIDQMNGPVKNVVPEVKTSKMQVWYMYDSKFLSISRNKVWFDMKVVYFKSVQGFKNRIDDYKKR